MRVLDSEKAIALLERAKKLLPGNDGILPQKYLSKDGMDAIIQGLREHTVDLDILANTIGLAGKKKDQDTLLAGFDHTHGDIAVLIIGRKESDDLISRSALLKEVGDPDDGMVWPSKRGIVDLIMKAPAV